MYIAHNFAPGETIRSSDANDMDYEIIRLGETLSNIENNLAILMPLVNTLVDYMNDGGLSKDYQNSLLNCFKAVAWDAPNGAELIENLKNAIAGKVVREWEIINSSDVETSGGFGDFAIDEYGTTTAGSAKTFSLFVLNSDISRIRYNFGISGKTGKRYLIFKKDDDGYIGTDGAATTRFYRFRWNESEQRYTSEQITGYSMSVSGDFSFGDAIEASVEDGYLNIKDRTNGSSCRISDANCIGFWSSATSGVLLHKNIKKEKEDA